MPTNRKPKLHIRWRDLPKEDFLLRCLRVRDTPTFARRFAEWLSNPEQCHVRLVRVCFDTEPDAHLALCRQKLLRGRFARLSSTPSVGTGNSKRVRRDDRASLAARREFAEELSELDRKFRQPFVAGMVRELRLLHPYEQVTRLNQHLKEKHLLPKPESEECETEGSWDGKPLTSVRPRFIRHEEIQEAFYTSGNNPKTPKEDFRKPERALAILGEDELGASVITAFARKKLPDTAHGLRLIASALWLQSRDTPTFPCPCVELREKPLLAFLMAQFAASRGPSPVLERAFKGVARAHLALFGANQARRGSPQSLPRISLGFVRNRARLVEDVRDSIRKAADWPPGTDPKSRRARWSRKPPTAARDLASKLRLILRAAIRHRDFVEALRRFFFCGLPMEEAANRPGLVDKLGSAFDRDLTFLSRFLFARGVGNRPRGLLAHWQVILADGSSHRLKKAEASAYDSRLRLRRDGMTEAELFPHIQQLAGAKPSPPSLVSSQLKARGKRVRRLGR